MGVVVAQLEKFLRTRASAVRVRIVTYHRSKALKPGYF